jgi:hypothetical protein
MRPMVQVTVNQREEHRIASGADIDGLCSRLAHLPVFTLLVVTPEGENGGTLEVIVESGRASVFFAHISRRIKLGFRNKDSSSREIVSLQNDAYPELGLDQIEIERRDLVSPATAITILRHFLLTGEVIDLVPWPPDDWDDKRLEPEAQPPSPVLQDLDIPF